MNEDSSLILSIAAAFEQPSLYHTIYQFDSTVMLQLQPLGEFTNTGRLIWAQGANNQQHLVLLRLYTGLPLLLFAEAQESAELIATFSQYLVVGLREVFFSRHRRFLYLNWQAELEASDKSSYTA